MSMRTRERWMLGAAIVLVGGSVALVSLRDRTRSPVVRSAAPPGSAQGDLSRSSETLLAEGTIASDGVGPQSTSAPQRANSAESHGAGEESARRVRAEWLLSEGVKLIELNKIDDSFAARSVEDVERGVARVEEALRMGHPRRKEGLGSLADGYVAIATLDPWRAGEAVKRLDTIYKELQAIDPPEARWFIDHHEMSGDPGTRKDILRRGVERLPRNFELRMMLGTALCEEGDKTAGSAQLVRAAEVMTLRDALDVGDVLLYQATVCYEDGNQDARRAHEVVSRKIEEARKDEQVMKMGE